MPSTPTWPKYSLDWLTSPVDSTLFDPIEIERIEYKIPPDQGSASLQSLSLSDGITLFHATHDMTPSPLGQLMHLMDVQIEPAEPIFTAQIWLHGLGCHREYWYGRHCSPVDIIASPGLDTFRHHLSWQAQILVAGGVCSEMCSVAVPHSTLNTLLGDEDAHNLLAGLGLTAGQPTVVRAMPAIVGAHLQNAPASHLVGTPRRLFAQARLLDYLASLLDFVSSRVATTKTTKNKQRVQEVHDHLMGLEGQLPTLTELAKKFGLSARSLNEEFKEVFGKPIYRFIADHRLMQAQHMITTTAVPLKVLAARLGYSHVNHFISAFKKKFGHPPGSLRRK